MTLYTQSANQTLDMKLNSNLNNAITKLESALLKISPKDVHLEASVEFTDLEQLSPQEYDSITEEITNDLLDTPYKPGRIEKLVKKCELDLCELNTVSNLILHYSIKPASIEKLILGGIPINELDDFLNLYKKDNGAITYKTKKIEPLSHKSTETYVVANAENYISYDNMLFIRDLIKNGTARQVKETIENIELTMFETDCKLGTGTIIHRMRDLYNENDKYKYMSIDLVATLAINADPENSAIFKHLQDQDSY